MSLYLCVFDNEEELEGVEVGSYEDFGFFRDIVCNILENGKRGSKFPILMLHSDSDGAWTEDEVELLEKELRLISEAFRKEDQMEFHSDWQKDLEKSLGLKRCCLYDCFIDVDGEPLLDRLLDLCGVTKGKKLPILFQ